jgi:hypothetical protein
MPEHMKQTILAFLDDLFLLPRIQDAAQRIGYSVKLYAPPEDMGIERAGHTPNRTPGWP